MKPSSVMVGRIRPRSRPDGMSDTLRQASARTTAVSDRGYKGGYNADSGPTGTMPVGLMNLRLS
jgi:hypothetical protein